jgi:hypothetical protein
MTQQAANSLLILKTRRDALSDLKRVGGFTIFTLILEAALDKCAALFEYDALDS